MYTVHSIYRQEKAKKQTIRACCRSLKFILFVFSLNLQKQYSGPQKNIWILKAFFRLNYLPKYETTNTHLKQSLLGFK